MKIPLNEFEQYIDETILKRGLQYFKKGLVNEPEEVGPGEYEALVYGTDLYTVRLSVKNGVISEYACSCPYDMGPVCKHVVAVIFYLQQEEIKIYKKTVKKTAVIKQVPKKKTIEEQVDGILEKLSHEQLKEFIKERCLSERTFRQSFLANFSFLVNPESKKLYAQQVRAILSSNKDRNGFIGYAGARNVGIAVYELLQRAEKLIATPDYPSAFQIACAVLEEMTKALQFAEDSNGDIGDSIWGAIAILENIVSNPIKEKYRVEFLNYFINSFRKELFRGWDWHMKMIELAVHLVVNNNEANVIYCLLDKIEQSDTGWNNTLAKGARLTLISKIEGEEKARQFLMDNISNPDFRKIAIEAAIGLKDYTAVILLAEDGLSNESSQFKGLIDDWKHYLLRAYVYKEDDENVIKYARELFLNSNREKEQYYNLLKSTIPGEEWDDFMDQLIQDVLNNHYRGDYYFIAQVYIWEEKWDRLFDFVQKNLSLSILAEYEKYLMKDYGSEIPGLYQSAIFDYLENNVGRNFYQTVCRNLRKLIKMGYREKVDLMIRDIRKMYLQRKALIEELDRV